MTRTLFSSRFTSLRSDRRRALLAGTSVFTLLFAVGAAQAGSLGAALAQRTTAITSAATSSTTSSLSSAAATTSQSMADLTKSASALKAALTAQAAAAKAAMTAASNSVTLSNGSTVTATDGLSANGLVPDSGLSSTGVANTVTTWTNLGTPTQTTSNGTTTVTVKQTAEKAIANWSSFNVGANTTLSFDQASASYVVLNRVTGASTAPSVILGTIKAEGSVYVINQNGIVFGSGSQVNVHSLVASSLCLFSCTVGDANTSGTSTYDFLTYGIGDATWRAKEDSSANYPNGLILTSTSSTAGNITIEEGASISAGDDGMVLIAAPNVTNGGTITAPGGQVALIAGFGVNYFFWTSTGSMATSKSSDASDTLAFVNYDPLDSKSAEQAQGQLINTGVIEADRGNVTLLGGAVTQDGVVATTTSVASAGSIIINTGYSISLTNNVAATAPTQSFGAVIFGPESVTTILPDSNGATVPTSSVEDGDVSLGSITIGGGSIDFQSGSLIYAPGQTVTASIGASTGRILVEDGAVIDVSGIADVEVPISDDIYTFKVTANDVADTPLAESLIGDTVTINLSLSGTRADGESWVGSPLFAATGSGYLGLVAQSIDQVLTKAGSVSLKGAEVDLASGSLINLMGGYVHYTGATVNTTKVLDAYGNITNIGSADYETKYVGVVGAITVTDAKWGVTTTYPNPLIDRSYYLSDYIEGGDAGSLTLDVTYTGLGTSETTVAGAGALVMAGTVDAEAVSGINQIAAGSLASGGTLTITTDYSVEIGDSSVLSATSLAASSLPSGFSMASPLLASSPPYSNGNVLTGTELDQPGYSGIAITSTYGVIIEDAGTTVAVRPGGSITLAAKAVDIEGALAAHGGAVSIYLIPTSGTMATYVDPYLSAGQAIRIGSSGEIDVSGLFVNDTDATEATESGPADIDGGTISLIVSPSSTTNASGAVVDATGNITLAAGSLLDLDSGAYVKPNGQLDTKNGLPVGTGGSLAIEDDTLPSLISQFSTNQQVILDGTITALGFTGGGTLTLGSAAFQVGGDASAARPSYALHFDPSYWGSVGFASFNLLATYDIVVPDGTAITLTHANRVADATIVDAPTGADLSAIATVAVLPEGLRSPTNLSIAAGQQHLAVTDTNYGYVLDIVGTADYGTAADTTGLSLDEVVVGAGASIISQPGLTTSGSIAGATISLGQATGESVIQTLSDDSSHLIYSIDGSTAQSIGQVLVYGSLEALGGTIGLTSSSKQSSTSGYVTNGIYLGPQSLLDVAGTTVPTPLETLTLTTEGEQMLRTGTILSGGSITLTDDRGGAIAVAKGAVLDVAGAADSLDVAVNSGSGLVPATYRLETEWSAAGTVTIASAGDVLFDGTLIGNGGASSAEGGTLVLHLDDDTTSNNFGPVVLVQNATAAGLNLVDGVGSFVPAKYAPGETYSDTDTSSFVFGVDSLNGSGFDNLTVQINATDNDTGGTLAFSGAVTLNLRGDFIVTGLNPAKGIVALPQGAFTLAGAALTGNGSLSVSAAAITLDGRIDTGSTPSAATTGDGVLTLSAQEIDIDGAVELGNISQATFSSSGDLRFLPDIVNGTAGVTELLSSLFTNGNLILDAARIYAATDTLAIIEAVSSSAATTVTFGYPGGETADTSVPLSAGGTLVVAADTIDQYGNLVQPFGQIYLGIPTTVSGVTELSSYYLPAATATTKVVLEPGSITSVSGDGATIPYGSTVDGTSWYYDPLLDTTSASSSTATALTAPPAKEIVVAGATIDMKSGATVNLSGGGDLQASEWVAGTGGERDVLSATNITYSSSSSTGTAVSLYADGRNVYAVIPGYSGSVAAYDPYIAASLSTSASGQASYVGESVYLSGVAGLPAGIYTLLPGRYATLPGAYRVVVDSGVTNPLASSLTTLADGTVEAAGYFVNALTGTRTSSNTLEFLVQSASVWGKYSEYTTTSANTFFTALAKTDDTVAVNLPMDAGHLEVGELTTTSLAFDATMLTSAASADGTEGAGAEIDIVAKQIEIVDDEVQATQLMQSGTLPAGTVALGADELDGLNAGSLLIGGVRTLSTSGVTITPEAESVIVANDAAHPLAAPEVLLVATPEFTLTPETYVSTVSGTPFGSVYSTPANVYNDWYLMWGQYGTLTVSLPVTGTGRVVVDNGSVIKAVGSVGRSLPVTIGDSLTDLTSLPSTSTVSQISDVYSELNSYYATLATDLFSLVQVSNGTAVTVNLPSTAQLNPASSITLTDDVYGAIYPGTYSSWTLALPSLIASGAATVSIQAGAILTASGTLQLAATGDSQVAVGATLSAPTVRIVSSQITFLGQGADATNSTIPTSGVVLDATALSDVTDTSQLILESEGTIDFLGDAGGGNTVSLDLASGTLDLSAGAFTTSSGAAVTIAAPVVQLTNALSASTTGTVTATGGSLTVNAGEVDFGTGTKTQSGFSTITVNAASGIVGQGTGSFDFGAAAVTFNTPVVIAGSDSSQSLTTTGAFTLNGTAGTALSSSSAVGGAITLTGATLTDSALIEAPAGNVTLEATSGDLYVGADIGTAAVAKQFYDETEYDSAGAITLTADQGSVSVASGVTLDFSATAAGGGNAGSLSVAATKGNFVLDGSIAGGGAAGYTGGAFSLNVEGAEDMDMLAALLTKAGITKAISVHTRTGDLSLSQTLTASSVTLTADGGSVIVTDTGVIDASGTAGGTIGLYGAGGVDVEGSLLANGTSADEIGGTVTLGTSGTGSTTSLNSTYGYENVASSGAIVIGPSAVIDISGGSLGGNAGGTLIIRAPILEDGDVNVTISPTATIRNTVIGGGTATGGVFLDAYAVWSTADNSTNANQHFDGIVDPAGWYTSSGTLEPGSFTTSESYYTSTGTFVTTSYPLFTWDGTTLTQTNTSISYVDYSSGSAVTHTLTFTWNSTADTLTVQNYDSASQATTTATYSDVQSYLLTNDYFTPTTYNAAHAVFYGGYDPNSETFNPSSPDAGSLPAFIQNPGFNFGSRFSDLPTGVSLTVRPEVDLVNPETTANSGNISVLTNWNLGAGVENSDGTITYAYRYNDNGVLVAPVISLRAAGDVDVDASITDGFFATASISYPATNNEDTAAATKYKSDMSTYSADLTTYTTNGINDDIASTTILNVYSGGNSTSTSSATIGTLESSDSNYDLVTPESGGSLSYYTEYNTYLTDYTTWATLYSSKTSAGLLTNDGYHQRTVTSGKTTTTYTYYLVDPSIEKAPSTAAPVLSNYATYPLYEAAYLSWFNSVRSTTKYVAYTAPAPPSSSDTSTTDWTDYYTAYIRYYSGATAYLDTTTTTSATGCSTTTCNSYWIEYIQAPAAPVYSAAPTSTYAESSANLPSNMATADTPLPLLVATLMSGNSASYRIVAGADIDSADPLAVVTGSGNVTIDDHTAYTYTAAASNPSYSINGLDVLTPTMIRTGNGSIDIAAGDDIDLADTTAPGVIYTAGTPAAGTTADASNAWTVTGTYYAGGNTSEYGNPGTYSAVVAVLSGAVTPEGAGEITLTAGNDITGGEQIYDTNGSVTSRVNNYIGQNWTDWLTSNSADSAVAWYVNFGNFDQGVLSMGGNITITAGGNIRDLSVSLPTSARITTAASGAETLTYYGGGVLTVTAGGSILSGDYYVGQGSGTLTAGGEIGSDFTYFPYGAGVSVSAPTLLAVQNGTITVTARQSVDIGGIYDPTTLGTSGSIGGLDFTSMTAASAVSIQSNAGSIAFNDFNYEASLFYIDVLTTGVGVNSTLLPASLSLVAVDGGIDIGHGGGLYPSATGNLTVIADGDITMETGVVQNTTDDIPYNFFGLLDYPDGILATALDQSWTDLTTASPSSLHSATLLHADDSQPVRLYSLSGDISDGVISTTGTTASHQLVIEPDKQAIIRAGGDITDLVLYGQNDAATDVTEVIAGGNIVNLPALLSSDETPALLELAGPGELYVQAGGDINFASQREEDLSVLTKQNVIETGIRTIGNSTDTDTEYFQNVTMSYLTNTNSGGAFGDPYLPQGGASVTVLFGVGKGVDYTDAIAKYVDTTTGGIGFIGSITSQLETTLDTLATQATTSSTAASQLNALLASWGLSTVSLTNGLLASDDTFTLTDAKALSIFQNDLSASKRDLLVDHAFLAFLKDVAADYADSSSTYYKQYARGYQAINTLFPAAYGYTDNSSGGSNGASATVSTGTLDMRGSTIQTQQGGDISILGPGGSILVGTAMAPPSYVTQSSEGIITFESGSIYSFTDQDVDVAQSRVMTEQGGDIVMWSSNGNLDAGKGVKTSYSFPAPVFSCDNDWDCTVDVKGLATGAGIAVLQTLADAAVGDADLMAPHGTVDAGAAGIRASGNVNIVALHVLNAFNITAGGAITGVPVAAMPNLGALTTASNTAGAASATADAASRNSRQTGPRNSDLPSIITIEVIGYGGGAGGDQDEQQQQEKKKKGARYDQSGPVQVYPGTLSADQIRR